MQGLTGRKINDRWLSIGEIAIVIVLALVPLFISFPYRVNIFLSWEGAYRMSQGDIPYRDFGMPLGYMYWVIPSIFFKVFGVQLITLVKAQVFINIVSGLAFRQILKFLDVQPGVRFLSVFLYCISFSFFNFWPWYNHTVIVYQIAGLAFLFGYFSRPGRHWIWLSLAGLFSFCAFFTKQDAGALAFFLSLALLIFYCFLGKSWKPLGIYLLSFGIVAFALVAPFTQFGFSYWFNLGQPPHTARISIGEILNEFFLRSQWLKFYLFIILILAIARYRSIGDLQKDRKESLFLLLTVGIIVEAAIFQVTSYTPPDNNIFFHSFAFAFILSALAALLNINFSKITVLIAGTIGLLIWWSSVFWGYIQRFSERQKPLTEIKQNSHENIVDRNTYIIHTPDTTEIPFSQWKFSSLKTFEKIYLPAPTVDGMERIVKMDLFKNNPKASVLNMTELTPLAAEIPYTHEKGEMIPLWHHLGVGMFNQQAEAYEKKIRARQYDLILFEYIPRLNNFFPFRVRDSIYRHYKKIDQFPAPRRGDTQGVIEVFVR